MSTDEQHRAYARSVFGDNDDGTLHPDDADWTAERLPTAILMPLIGDRAAWKAWFDDEVAARYEEIEPGYSVHWEEFAKEETDEEIVVSIVDGTVQIWDGWHRTAGAIIRGAETIPAVVGRPKPALTLQPG